MLAGAVGCWWLWMKLSWFISNVVWQISESSAIDSSDSRAREIDTDTVSFQYKIRYMTNIFHLHTYT